MTNCLGKRCSVHVFRERLSVCVCASFSFGFKSWMWDLIALSHDHCLDFEHNECSL